MKDRLRKSGSQKKKASKSPTEDPWLLQQAD